MTQWGIDDIKTIYNININYDNKQTSFQEDARHFCKGRISLRLSELIYKESFVEFNWPYLKPV